MESQSLTDKLEEQIAAFQLINKHLLINSLKLNQCIEMKLEGEWKRMNFISANREYLLRVNYSYTNEFQLSVYLCLNITYEKLYEETNLLTPEAFVILLAERNYQPAISVARKFIIDNLLKDL